MSDLPEVTLLSTVGCFAISGTGDASNSGDLACGKGCVAITSGGLDGSGTASNTTGAHGCYTTSGILVFFGIACVAVSGTGDAVNQAGPGSCVDADTAALAVVGVACLAISGMGDASNYTSDAPPAYSCGGPFTWSVACVAVSGTGEASNSEEACAGPAPAVLNCVEVGPVVP